MLSGKQLAEKCLAALANLRQPLRCGQQLGKSPRDQVGIRFDQDDVRAIGEVPVQLQRIGTGNRDALKGDDPSIPRQSIQLANALVLRRSGATVHRPVAREQ